MVFARHLSIIQVTTWVLVPSDTGVLSQATKNKTYTPKIICRSTSKDRSHGEYLA